MTDMAPPLDVPAPETTGCRRCSASIFLARVPSGRLEPFELDDDGEWCIFQGAATHQGKAPWRNLGFGPGVPRYTRHFERCTGRRRRRKT